MIGRHLVIEQVNRLRQVPTQGADESIRVNNVSGLINGDIYEQHEPLTPSLLFSRPVEDESEAADEAFGEP